MATELEQTLIDSRGNSQALISGNAQGNGYVAASYGCKGKLAWTRYYSDFDSMMQPLPRRILVHDDAIGVVLQEDLLLFDYSGTAIRSEVLGDYGLAAFGEDSYCWVTQSRQLSCRKFDGRLIVDGHAIPLLSDQSKLRLLYPLGNDFIAVRQYFSGLPVRSNPTSVSTYRMEFGKSAWEWIAELDGLIKYALLTGDNELLVLLSDTEFRKFAVKDGQERGIFSMAMDTIAFAFVNQVNQIVVFGIRLDGDVAKPVIRCLSLEGTLVWEHELLVPVSGSTPASGRNGEIYYFESGFLFCIADGVEKWRTPHSPMGRIWITTCASGEIIATDARTVSMFSDTGKLMQQMKCPNENDSFSTPAAMAAGGRLIVSGKFALYCFE